VRDNAFFCIYHRKYYHQVNPHGVPITLAHSHYFSAPVTPRLGGVEVIAKKVYICESYVKRLLRNQKLRARAVCRPRASAWCGDSLNGSLIFRSTPRASYRHAVGAGRPTAESAPQPHIFRRAGRRRPPQLCRRGTLYSRLVSGSM
jgi:hypothetical protein